MDFYENVDLQLLCEAGGKKDIFCTSLFSLSLNPIPTILKWTWFKGQGGGEWRNVLPSRWFSPWQSPLTHLFFLNLPKYEVNFEAKRTIKISTQNNLREFSKMCFDWSKVRPISLKPSWIEGQFPQYFLPSNFPLEMNFHFYLFSEIVILKSQILLFVWILRDLPIF